MKRITSALVAAGAITAALVTNKITSNHDTPIIQSTIIDVSDTLKFPKVDSPIEFLPLHTGGTVKFELEQRKVVGRINAVHTSIEGVIRVGGEFDGGTFCFALEEDSTTHGVVMMSEGGVCYTMDPTLRGGNVTWINKKMSDIACVEVMPLAEGALAVASNTTINTTPITTRSAVPIYNSKPDAKTVLLLDFIGGTVQDPLWNGGKVIDVKPAMYSLDQIKQVYDIVAERYAAFNVNITTDVNKYATAPVKNRMRILLTTTNFINGYGGYSFIGSLKLAGTSIYSANIPCFAFVSNVGNAKNAGEVAAHELGHTFGLTHDGKTGTSATTYYTGQGSWAPVMGTAYSKPVVQWSKGEYKDANNKQDDLTVIATTPGVGYSTASNTCSMINLGSNINAKDVISNSSTSRYFQITVVTGGTLTVDVHPVQYSGLNAVVELLTPGSQSIIKSNPLNDINTKISTTVKAGKYVIRVGGEGEGDAFTTGYSAYSSIGTFILTGTIK